MNDVTPAQTDRNGGDAGYGFGAFKGVFTPSLLTILGVIMYLRFGWVLGNVGLGMTLFIVTLATSITFLTGLSMSALATNRRVGGGGAYYIISRSLGVEAGAAVGLPLFFAQALSISFYIAGFSEVATSLMPGWDPQVVGFTTLAVLGTLALISADIALKTQLVILLLILASLVSVFAGGAYVPETGAVPIDAPPPVPFWVVFAVFFPAVTGIEAGIAMSGDLKEPAKSLPRGTLAAVGAGFLVYLCIPVYLDWRVPDAALLRAEPLILQDIARWGSLILVGVWCATLSSALGALLGAPRTLQALARDRVVPRILGKGVGPANNPRMATLITFAVAAVGIAAGDLNQIAPVLSMFFLTSYGVLNISAGLEEAIQPPSWRPTFRIHWAVSLLGAFGCFAIMFMISAGATLMALLVSGGVYWMMKRRSLRSQWGDMTYGILMLAARGAISRLAVRKPDERTWMPNILVFSGAPTKRWYLIELAHAIARNRAFMTCVSIIPTEAWSGDRAETVRETIRGYLAKRDVDALVKVMPHDDPLVGALELVRGYGFGPLVPNTIFLGETEQRENFLPFAELTRHIQASKRNLVIVRERADVEEDPTLLHQGSRIDLWWRGEESNVALMVTLAYLMQRSPGWQGARLCIKQIIDPEESKEDAENRLADFVERQRLDAEIEVRVKEEPNVFDTIRHLSAGADLVLFGMRAPREGESLEAYSISYKLLLKGTADLPPTAYVLAAQDIAFSRIFEEEG